MASHQTLEKIRHFSNATSGPDGPRAITVQEQLIALQWAQLKHDELYHKEITLLPVADRMKHFALHMAKYLGYFAEALDSNDDERFERTLVDAFIISLAAANTLNLDLGQALSRYEAGASTNLREIGSQLAIECLHQSGDKVFFLKRFATHCGRLAKACESLDHVENHPFREAMLRSVLDMFQLSIAQGAVREIDLVNRARARLTKVEAKSMFHTYYK